MCMNAQVYLCMRMDVPRICKYIHMQMHMHTWMCKCRCICVCVFVRVCACVCVFVSEYVFMRERVCVDRLVHLCMHLYVYMHL